MVKKVLVLGGTGAMGCYLVDFMAQSGEWDVWVTTRSVRSSENERVHYIQGNARDESFIKSVLKEKWDAIVDFMNYDYEEYASRCSSLLAATNHYIWFSSCRVYAESATPLTEESPRLLETSTDTVFLATNRYALRKARQEDLLKKSNYKNYTIIRPYITYSEERLQLGIYEKEQWLWRILKGKPLVINKNILDKKTSLSHGLDVSHVIAQLVGKTEAYAQVVQIATDETMTWAEILNLYCDILQNKTGKRPVIYTSDNMKAIDELYEGGYNTIYDCVYHRSFSSLKAERLIGKPVSYVRMIKGLSQCLNAFIAAKHKFLAVNPQYEAYQDILTGEYMTESDFVSKNLYDEYMKYRHTSIEDLDMEKDLERY